ncbi:MAG: hypothetical protein ACP5NW_01620 [Candidatus Woesearchaeota archaeon]
MPHIMREEHLEDICAKCRKPHGNSVLLKNLHHKIYEIIICQNCGYEIVRIQAEREFNNKWDMFHKI